MVTIDDLERAAAPVRFQAAAGQVPSHATAEFTVADGTACEAQFSWGLLQRAATKPQ